MRKSPPLAGVAEVTECKVSRRRTGWLTWEDSNFHVTISKNAFEVSMEFPLFWPKIRLRDFAAAICRSERARLLVKTSHRAIAIPLYRLINSPLPRFESHGTRANGLLRYYSLVHGPHDFWRYPNLCANHLRRPLSRFMLSGYHARMD